MLELKNKIAFITGASSGIGKATAEQLAAQGTHLILTARRVERLNQLVAELQRQYPIKALPLQLDVRDKMQVETVIQSLPTHWQPIDIVVNNAGLALTSDNIQDGNPDNWDTMIDTNVKGLLYVFRAIIPGMLARNNGHIINICSTAGHDYYQTGNVYCATKHAVKALSRTMRLDLMGTAIRVSNISPGATETEFSDVRWQNKDKAKAFYSTFNPLNADDIADAIVYVASRPLHVDVAEMIIFPTQQASVHHIWKKV